MAKSERTRGRRWGLAVVTATVIPLLLVGALELGLRLVGYGVPSSFFVPVEGRVGVLTSNPRFGWRFFPPRLAREPVVAEMAAEKPEDVYRVFVLGGSAALGTPEPAVGMPRVFAALLREAWPERRFEVVTLAMAAVNSHVVRLVAREVADHEPDLMLVYLGNNEVVGPYGPGSVFGRSTPSLPAVRAALWARGTHLGQLLQSPAQLLARGDTEPGEWRGLEMFIERPVAADDPRLIAVYNHLRDNLHDIVKVGTGAGAEVALSTVAVNLLDSPPFASRPPEGLPEEERARWQAAVERGVGTWEVGDFADSIDAFQEAVGLDAGHAELRYRLGRALLAVGREAEARPHFVAARDLDSLRFRADSRINQVIREVAGEAKGEAVTLIDAEEMLAAAASTPGLPGDDLFYEHVHLRFPGNYLLARAFFDALAPRLAEQLGPPTGEPPSLQRCAERLGLTDSDRLRMAETILQMTADRPPFSGQIEADWRTDVRRAEVREFRGRVGGSAAERAALALDEAALAAWPEDLLLRQGWAETLGRQGRPAEAAAEWRRLSERIPGVVEWQTRLGFALADAGDSEGAVAELRRALELRPDSAEGRVNLGTALEVAGDLDGSEALYRQALDGQPGSEGARLNLARLLEHRGDFAAAEAEYRRAVADHPRSATAHRRLGEAYDRRGDLEAAAEHYRAALARAPDAAAVHNNLGQILERQGRAAEAAESYDAATRSDPGYALAWFNLGDLLLSYGRPGEAAPAYQLGLTLEPGNRQARSNLETALRDAGRPSPDR